MSPFRLFMKTNFPFVEGTYEANDLWGLFCKLVEHFNQVEGVTETLKQNLNSLYEFLNTLELQDEVNNKLDEMAESGELQEIMAAYLNSRAIFGFDNIADLKTATNLIDGSYVRTLGFYNINDSGGSLYHIRTITNDDIVNEKTKVKNIM